MKKQIIIILSIIIILLAIVVVDILFFKNIYKETLVQYLIDFFKNEESVVPEDKEILVEEEFILPSEQELLNWKTYNSEKFGFEIKYPIGWTRAFTPTEISESVAFNSPPEPISEGEELLISPKVVISIVSSENIENLDLEMAAEDVKERSQRLGYELISENRVLFKNIIAEKIIFSDEKIDIVYYVLIKNNNIYKISSEVFKREEESVGFFKKVISTFEFLDN